MISISPYTYIYRVFCSFPKTQMSIRCHSPYAYAVSVVSSSAGLLILTLPTFIFENVFILSSFLKAIASVRVLPSKRTNKRESGERLRGVGSCDYGG